jgi:hypothetical protein
MVATTLGQFGPDLLHFLWNLADHHAKLTCGFNIGTAVTTSNEQAMDYRKLRGLKYHENRYRLLTCLYEEVATRVLGATFNLTCSPAYHQWLDRMCSNWPPVLPTTDPDLRGTPSTQTSTVQSPSSPSSPNLSPLRADAEASQSGC